MIKNQVTYKIGNILDATENILVQQGNAQAAMGGGLAGKLIKKYPKLKQSFKQWSSEYDSPKERMGKVHVFGLYPGQTSDGKIIMTIVGQLNYGRDGKLYTDYDALAEGLVYVGNIMKRMKQTIAIPYFLGCGLAGGDWKIVRQQIESWHTVTNDFARVYALNKEIILEEDYKRFGIK